MDPTSRLGKRLTTVTFPEQGDIPRTGRHSPNRFGQTTTHPVRITCQAKHGRHARKIVPSAEASGPCNRLAIPPTGRLHTLRSTSDSIPLVKTAPFPRQLLYSQRGTKQIATNDGDMTPPLIDTG